MDQMYPLHEGGSGTAFGKCEGLSQLRTVKIDRPHSHVVCLLYEDLCKHLAILTRRVEAVSRDNPICRRLMTAPGVGPIIALSLVTAVDDPRRFSKNEESADKFRERWPDMVDVESDKFICSG